MNRLRAAERDDEAEKRDRFQTKFSLIVLLSYWDFVFRRDSGLRMMFEFSITGSVPPVSYTFMLEKALTASSTTVASMSSLAGLNSSEPKTPSMSLAVKDLPVKATGGVAVVQSWRLKAFRRALMIGALKDKVPGMIATIRVKREVKRGAMSWARMMAANTTTKMGMRSVNLPRSSPSS